MSGDKAKGSKKNRKFGNNKVYCTRYLVENRQAKNKIIRLNRHLKNQPNDNQAIKALRAA